MNSKRKAKMDDTTGYRLPVFVSRQTFVNASRIKKVAKGPVSYIFELQARPGAVYAYAFEQTKDMPEPQEGMYYVVRGPYDFTFMTAEEFDSRYVPGLKPKKVAPSFPGRRHRTTSILQ